MKSHVLSLAALLTVGVLRPARADLPIPELRTERVDDGITVDGVLSEPAWRKAGRIDEWFETSPGDNVTPKVESIGYLAYDDRYLYAGFDFRDPDPRRIRAPVGDRDSLTSNMDHGGVLIDTRNDGRTAVVFAASARGIQYDSIWDDAVAADDTAPDFYWDAAAQINSDGWTLEMRIPFSSLRYTDRNPETWRIMLYRIYPREFWYQMLSTTWPRGVDCWVCRSNHLRGLSNLPPGGSLVVAPYASEMRSADPRMGLGSQLAPAENHTRLGADVKWAPGASHVIDLTLKPDFSQVEADVPQITANERFALFYPEKRPFFLEGRDLFTTPIQALYTRTVTSPEWGLRATGRSGTGSYTALLVKDEGGGSVILPGSTDSSTAEQDFSSQAFLGRIRWDLGRGFVGMAGSGRWIDGGGSNVVFGPDFRYQPNLSDALTGQLLLSHSVTPQRPDLTDEWDGRRLADHAADLRWRHSAARLDWLARYTDLGQEFRADNGFVPQVGYRDTYGEAGYTFRPEGFIRRLRTFAIADRSVEPGGDLLSSQLSFGFGMSGRWDSFVRLRYAFDRIRSDDEILPRQQFIYILEASPSRVVSQIHVDGFAGQEIDFVGSRVGRGFGVNFQASLRPNDHLELQISGARRWLDVDLTDGGRGRLFTARVDRLRTIYSFSSRSFVRLIAQRTETLRDPTLFAEAVSRRDGSLSGSALFVYRLTWQTALLLGYGDERELTADEQLTPAHRELFIKLSYAFQR